SLVRCMMITLAVDNGRQGKVDQLGLECVVGVTLTNLVSTATTTDDSRGGGGGSIGILSIASLLSLIAYRRYRK
ncbi:GlyGly-CTERM sorting domain-containing protein, partial [Acinetobacter baumannii]